MTNRDEYYESVCQYCNSIILLPINDSDITSPYLIHICKDNHAVTSNTMMKEFDPTEYKKEEPKKRKRYLPKNPSIPKDWKRKVRKI